MAPVVPGIPERRGGWWHEYVCPTHGTELHPARDGVFPCPHGCALTGEPYAGAWAVLAHQAAARSLRRLAVEARSGDPAAGDAAVAGLTRYAELYRRLATENRADAQPWMLAGKLFQQALTEAIWGVSVAVAVQTLVDVVERARLDPVLELLRALREGARDAREVLLGRDDFRNNYTAWLDAAGACTSRALALLGEPDETWTWLAGEHGIAEHAAAAVHPDGWEWEGSTYYHVFVLRAYLLALRGVPASEIPERLVGRLHAMTGVIAALGAMGSTGRLPALHDTPYGDPGWDEETYELSMLVDALRTGPSLSHLDQALARRLPTEVVTWRRAEAWGWFDPPVALLDTGPLRGPGHALFPDTGYALLHGGGCQAVLDYGPHGGSHGHLDKLALYLYGRFTPWQPAYGVPPYGHPLRKAYYARTAAHPTLTVDGADQCEATGRLLYWRPGDGSPGRARCEVGAEADVFPGVAFQRHVRTEPGHLIDLVLASTVDGADERDFALHLRTDVDVTVRRTPEGWHTHWPGDDGLVGLHAAAGPASLTTGADLGPADDPQRARPHLTWRVRAHRAVFASVYSPAGSAVSGLRLEEVGGELTVVVERDGAVPVRWSVPTAPTPTSVPTTSVPSQEVTR